MAKQRNKKSGKGSVLPVPKRKATVGLVMIVRNEETTLPRCLGSVRGIVDEMVVVDTGSTDRTREIAESFGARVGEFAWCDDFAMARNFALSLARCDWVLHLDADETLDLATAGRLRAVVNATPSGVWAHGIPVVSVVEEGGKVTDTVSHQRRLFRRLPGLVAYRRAIHEEVAHAKHRGSEGVARSDALRVLHEGYRDPDATRRKVMTRNLPILLRAHEEDPAEYYYLLQLCAFAAMAGEADRAANYFVRAYELMAESERRASELLPATCADLIRVLMKEKRHQEAWNAGMLLASYPPVPDLDYRRGQAALALGDAPTAKALFERARAAHGRPVLNTIAGATSWLPLWELTTCALLSHDSAAGLSLAAEALEQLPDSSGLLPRIALFALRVGDTRAAGAIDLSPSPSPLGEGGESDDVLPLPFREGGRGVRSIEEREILERVIRAMKAREDQYGLLAAATDLIAIENSTHARRLRARALSALGFHTQARDDMKQALSLDPHDLEAMLVHATILDEAGDHRGALTAYTRAADEHPDCGRAWYQVGRLMHHQGAVLDATHAARRAMELEPDNAAACRLLAECLRERGDIPEGCDVLIEVLQRRPDDKDTRMLLVSLLDAAGARDEALQVMAQAIDYHDRDAEVYVRLGKMLAERGNADDAFNAFEIALSLDPHAGVLQEALITLQRLANRPPALTGLRAAAAPAGLRFGRAAARN